MYLQYHKTEIQKAKLKNKIEWRSREQHSKNRQY